MIFIPPAGREKHEVARRILARVAPVGDHARAIGEDLPERRGMLSDPIIPCRIRGEYVAF